MAEGDVYEKMRAWFESEEGRAEMARRQKKTREIIKRLDEARRVDWRMLDEPYTI